MYGCVCSACFQNAVYCLWFFYQLYTAVQCTYAYRNNKVFFLELWNIFESHYSWRNIQQYNVDGSWFLKKSSHYFFFAFCLIRSTHVYSDSYCIHASPLYFLNSCWNMVFWFICRARYFFSLSLCVIHSIEFHRLGFVYFPIFRNLPFALLTQIGKFVFKKNADFV